MTQPGGWCSRRWELLVLGLLALALRLPGLGYGFPGIAHDDEWHHVSPAVSMLEQGSPIVPVADGAYINPTAYRFLVALAVLPVDARIKGGFPGGEGARSRYRSQREAYHWAARLLTSLLGVLGVLLLHGACAAVGGRRAAFLGAALLAVSPLHVRESHFATNDVALTTAICALLLLLVQGSAGRRRGAFSLGLAWGIACAVKYSAGLLGVCVGLGIWRGQGPARERARRLVLVAAGATLAFLLLFPASVLDTGEFLASFAKQARLGRSPWPLQASTPPWLLHLETILRSVGPLGVVLALIGLGTTTFRRRPEVWGYLPVHFLVFLPMPLFAIRFTLPLLPFLCLGVACGLGWGLPRLKRRGAGAVILVVALLAPLLLTSARLVRLLGEDDTRAQLHSWLEELLERERPRLAIDAGVMRHLPLGEDGNYDPRIAELVLVLNKPTRRLPLGREGAALLQGRADYVVLSASYLDPQPDREELLSALEELGELVWGSDPARAGERVPGSLDNHFAPWRHVWRRTRPGPRIWVYALRR